MDDDHDAAVEAERLRTGLRCLIRDWAEDWEDCTPFDQRDAYRRQPRRCCPGAGTMAHVQGCVNHPEAER